MTDPRAIIAAYEALCERALAVVDGAPYFKLVTRDEWVRVRVENGICTLSHFDTDEEWNSTIIDVQQCQFPADLLTMATDDFASWKAEHRRLYDDQQKSKAAAKLAAAEARDRAEYERLKGKFAT